MSDSDRRAAERVKVGLPARYHPEGGPDAPERFGTIDNISSSGLLLIAGETFPQGTRLRIAFEDKRGGRHVIISEVVRSQAMGGFAVAFIQVPNETLDYVRDAIGVS